MERTISSWLNCFLQDISVPCLVQWRPNSAWRFLAWNDSQDSLPPLWKCQVCSSFKCYFWSNCHLHLLRAAISLKVFTTYFSLKKEMTKWEVKLNLTDFLCMILSYVCFLSLENTRVVSFVDVEWDGQNVISICWGQSNRILDLSITGIFRSSCRSV